MDVVTGTEKIATQVGRWNPADVAYIRRVSFENWDGASFDLALLLLLQPRPLLSAGWPDPNGKFWEVEIDFSRVQDLVLTICGPWDIQTPGFSLDDIRERHGKESICWYPTTKNSRKMAFDLAPSPHKFAVAGRQRCLPTPPGCGVSIPACSVKQKASAKSNLLFPARPLSSIVSRHKRRTDASRGNKSHF